MGRTVNPKSLRARRINVLIHGHQRNQTFNVNNLGSALGPWGIRSSGTRVIHRSQLLDTISSVHHDRRLSWVNSSRPAFISRQQALLSLNSTCRVVGSSHSWLQGRQGYIYVTSRNINITTMPRYNFTELTLQDNQISRSNYEQQLLKEEKDTTPLAHQLSCANSTVPIGSVHSFHNRQEHLTEDPSLILMQIVLCFYFYFWLLYVLTLSNRSP